MLRLIRCQINELGEATKLISPNVKHFPSAISQTAQILNSSSAEFGVAFLVQALQVFPIFVDFYMFFIFQNSVLLHF
jgi:hypothetical protein